MDQSFILSPVIGEALVAAARALQNDLSKNYRAGDEARRIPEANIDMLRQADLLRVMVPKRLGGHGASMATQIAVSAALAKGCPSTSWVQTLLNVTTWGMSFLPGEGQKEVFFSGEQPLACGVLSMGGTASPAEGGFLINGKWPYASGCFYANWAAGGVAILDQDGTLAGVGTACMRMSDLTIEDTWKVVGMRGTGSNTLVAENVFVPAGRMGKGATPGAEIAEQLNGAESADRWPVASALALVLCGPILGMAQAALDITAASAGSKAIAYTTFPRWVDSHVAMRNIGKAAMDIEAARLLIMNAAAAVDELEAGHTLDALGRARLRGACGHAMELLRGAVDLLMSTAGASAFAEASPLQRFWRDLNTGSRHAFLGSDLSYEQFARTLLGEADIMIIV